MSLGLICISVFKPLNNGNLLVEGEKKGGPTNGIDVNSDLVSFYKISSSCECLCCGLDLACLKIPHSKIEYLFYYMINLMVAASTIEVKWEGAWIVYRWLHSRVPT